MQVKQGTKHPEASPWHRFTQMSTVVIGYPRNYQIRVIKLIRGSNILNNFPLKTRYQMSVKSEAMRPRERSNINVLPLTAHLTIDENNNCIILIPFSSLNQKQKCTTNRWLLIYTYLKTTPLRFCLIFFVFGHTLLLSESFWYM